MFQFSNKNQRIETLEIKTPGSLKIFFHSLNSNPTVEVFSLHNLLVITQSLTPSSIRLGRVKDRHTIEYRTLASQLAYS